MVKQYSLKLCGKRHPACSICKPGWSKPRPENANRLLRHRNTRIAMKLWAIGLLDGKCNRCGYFQCQRALVFHHPDDNKDFQLSRSWHMSREALESEILKCELLCANCHHEAHCDIGDLNLFRQTLAKSGRTRYTLEVMSNWNQPEATL